MGYQFIHYETYNATDARKEIGEGMRLPGFCPHVKNPQEPVILYGSTEGLADKIDALKSTTKRQITQKTRSGLIKTFERPLRDTEDVVLFGVASWPREWSQQNPRLYEKSKIKTLEKLKRDYGDQLEAVVFHDDEEHPHCYTRRQVRRTANGRRIARAAILTRPCGIGTSGQGIACRAEGNRPRTPHLSRLRHLQNQPME